MKATIDDFIARHADSIDLTRIYVGGRYPNAVTTDAAGNAIELQSPDGVVSWLCAHTSDYAGQPLEPNGTLDGNPDGGYAARGVFRALFPLVADAVRTFFADLRDRIRGLAVC